RLELEHLEALVGVHRVRRERGRRRGPDRGEDLHAALGPRREALVEPSRPERARALDGFFLPVVLISPAASAACVAVQAFSSQSTFFSFSYCASSYRE